LRRLLLLFLGLRTGCVRIAHLRSPPMAYYVVISDQGPRMDRFPAHARTTGLGRHATYMNALAEDGFVVLGGAIGDGTRHRARLIVRSSTEQDVGDRLARDPWRSWASWRLSRSRSGRFCWATSPASEPAGSSLWPCGGAMLC